MFVLDPDAVSEAHPVAAAITQPPCSAVASTQQPSWSWLIPKLWPISWAMVAAAPMDSSEWSCGRIRERPHLYDSHYSDNIMWCGLIGMENIQLGF